jgi:hypothetical protein
MDTKLRVLLACALFGAVACGPNIDKKGSKKTPPNNANNGNNSSTNGGTNASTNGSPNSTTGPNNQNTNGQTTACIDASTQVAFGAIPVGESETLEISVSNCSQDADLQLTGSSVQGPFALTLPEDRTIEPGGSTRVPVTFTPATDISYDIDATLSSNAGDATIQLTGAGTPGDPPGCPSAIIRAAISGDQLMDTDELLVERETTLDLSATTSSSPNGAIDQYEWTILSRPTTSSARIQPNANAAEPNLFVDVAGTYEIELDVVDETGKTSCEADRLVITADDFEETTVNVRLTWDTPMDDDQTDDVGTDLDLHYLHPTGTWDDPPWDCFWRNMTPDWGPAGDVGDPSVDRDDTNGAGPETISHTGPEDLVYRIGVYYFSDGGLGPSYATVRVSVGGQLLLESENVQLDGAGKFWYGITVEPHAMDAADTRQIVDGFP